jgi:hypothetical protein
MANRGPDHEDGKEGDLFTDLEDGALAGEE